MQDGRSRQQWLFVGAGEFGHGPLDAVASGDHPVIILLLEKAASRRRTDSRLGKIPVSSGIA
jgi:hypothetical protein